MPFFERGQAHIYYEEFGTGYPLFLLAPGFMNSSIPAWTRREPNPISYFGKRYHVIAMDQRHAGQSIAPVTDSDDWESFADDQMGLLDYLGIRECHVWGACIGVCYALRLMEMQPDRFVSGVFENPVGHTDRALEFRPFGDPNQDRSQESNDNRDSLMKLYHDWAVPLVQRRPDVDLLQIEAMGQRMLSKEFAFTVSRDFVKALETPLIVLSGDDIYHPPPLAEEIAALAPNAEFLGRDWRSEEKVAASYERIDAFLKRNTPVSPA